MTDIATISTILSSVKTATDLAKLIKNSDLSLNEAEKKLQIADLISSLADVKLEISELQQILIERDEIIRDLQGQLNQKAAIKYDGQVYWAENDDVPFCSVCYEKDSKMHHLTYSPPNEISRSNYHYCKICNATFYK